MAEAPKTQGASIWSRPHLANTTFGHISLAAFGQLSLAESGQFCFVECGQTAFGQFFLVGCSLWGWDLGKWAAGARPEAREPTGRNAPSSREPSLDHHSTLRSLTLTPSLPAVPPHLRLLSPLPIPKHTVSPPSPLETRFGQERLQNS